MKANRLDALIFTFGLVIASSVSLPSRSVLRNCGFSCALNLHFRDVKFGVILGEVRNKGKCFREACTWVWSWGNRTKTVTHHFKHFMNSFKNFLLKTCMLRFCKNGHMLLFFETCRVTAQGRNNQIGPFKQPRIHMRAKIAGARVVHDCYHRGMYFKSWARYIVCLGSHPPSFEELSSFSVW